MPNLTEKSYPFVTDGRTDPNYSKASKNKDIKNYKSEAYLKRQTKISNPII